MRFDFAANDAAKADDETDYELEIFQLPNAKEDGEEDYAAVRPTEELLLVLTQDVYTLHENPANSIDILNRIMLQAFNPEDITAALLENPDGRFDKYLSDELDEDGEPQLNPEGVYLARTINRLSHRRSTNPKRDKLGTETLASVAVWLVEKWSGKATGKPRDFLPPSRRTGTRSKRTSSSTAAKTRSRSSAKSV